MTVFLTDNAGDSVAFRLENLLVLRETFPQLFDEASLVDVDRQMGKRAAFLMARYFPTWKDTEFQTEKKYGVAISVIQDAFSEVPGFAEWFSDRIGYEAGDETP